jgi:antirestriction protein
MMHLAGWGYLAGYLELEEAYILATPIAYALQDTFSSWDEATENYMDGYAYWSRTDISQENTDYHRRIQIYEDLKAEQEQNGMLFNPDVWTQPVRGVKGLNGF